MATIETDIDIEALKNSGKRGRDLVQYAYKVLRYDGLKLAHTAIYAGTPHVNSVLASSMIGYKTQTLRNWACSNTGEMEPRRINGKTYWRMRDIRKILEI